MTAYSMLPTCVLPLGPRSPSHVIFLDIWDFPVLIGGLGNCPTACSLPVGGLGFNPKPTQKSVDRNSLTDTGF